MKTFASIIPSREELLLERATLFARFEHFVSELKTLPLSSDEEEEMFSLGREIDKLDKVLDTLYPN